MLITTQCNSCIFNSNPGCLLDKETEELIISPTLKDQRTAGFCNTKRTFQWYDAKKIQDLEHAKNMMNIEEQGISILIPLVSDKQEDIEKTIDSIINIDQGFVTSLFFVGSQLKKDQANKIANILEKALKNKTNSITWHLDNILLEEEFSVEDYIHHSFMKINEHWFMVLLPGDILTASDVANIVSFFDRIKEKHNLLCLYFEDDNHIKILTNKFAFSEMKGNVDSKFIDKVKIFDNWKSKCLKAKDMSPA